MNKQTLVTIVALAVAGIFFYAGGNIFMNQNNQNQSAGAMDSLKQGTDQTTSTNSGTVSAPENLVIEDEVVGTGDEAKSGMTVTVNYVGTLLNGTKFDSSFDRGVPFSFKLGAGSVIAGWDQGLLGMKVGGKRKLVIPAALAYGSREIGSIPANSPLVFEVELLKVSK